VATSSLPPSGSGPGSGAKPASYGLSGSDSKSPARRAEAAQREAREVERDLEARVEHARQESAMALEKESARESSALEAERARGYAALRELQRAQASELARVRREGERDLAQIKNHYENATLDRQKKAETELAQLERQKEQAKTFEQSSGQMQQSEIKQTQALRLQALKESEERSFQSLSEGARKRQEQAQVNDSLSSQSLESDFQRRHQAIRSTQENTLNQINARAAEELRQTRESTSQKLAAYQTRQSDPFYKLHDLSAELTERDDAFVLTARIPEHERDRLSVSVQGDRLLLSGFRRNQEKLELSPGRAKSSSSFQSYTESFPLRVPVDAKSLSREFEGDTLVVTVPKRGLDTSYQVKSAQHHPTPERARVEAPKFPGNLPKPRA
jgi:HSP20 family molecular chaperone IbpA